LPAQPSSSWGRPNIDVASRKVADQELGTRIR
jgi:hypothetical protein